ncbi:MAG TPA: POTRA domain-containing protein [Candidatus Acidoferrum sp.]|nr:POTRA domain-containing protein [Candidatus Acidoferrum sp.]
MNVRWPIAACLVGIMFAGALRASPQREISSANHDAASPLSEASAPIIDEIVFLGLRRIASAALQPQISSREGESLDARRIDADVRALVRLGWFGEISVETQPKKDTSSPSKETAPRVRLVFHFEEMPYLTGVEYTGSRLLSHAQIERLLSESHLTVRLGEPADPATLNRIAQTIRFALAELGHPQSKVQIRREQSSNATVHLHFEISDGLHIPVGRIDFKGNPELSSKLLRRQMRRITPGTLFSSLRGKEAYTREAFEEDRERILTYYQNHGYPEARIGDARLSYYEKNSLHWFRWPHRTIDTRLSISIPAQAGPHYRLGSIDASHALIEAGGQRGQKLQTVLRGETGKPYSAQAVEHLRRAWFAVIQPKPGVEKSASYRAVDTSRIFDPDSHMVGIKLGLSDAPPYIVRRIEIQGLHRFSDRFVRRRISLQEGRPLEDRALETGLAHLARTGYFRPIHKENIHIETDEVGRTADVTIHLQEVGQQRASFSGGQGQFGSTLGIAYTLFDLLQREELLAAQIDSGPESLQLLLGVAKEGFLGSRGSLALSVFNNILRPHFVKGVKGPFFTSQSEGLSAGWSYALTNTDSLGVNYSLSRSTTDYSLALPASLAGLAASDIHARTSSHSLGLGWTRDTGNKHLTFANSVSGGWLGGSENMLRSSEEYAHLFPDAIFSRQSTWAFRTSFGGAGSYQGDMPLYARIFSGDEQVRGLRTGELGPYASVSSLTPSGNTHYSAAPAGANLFSVANAEYRVPLGGGTQAAGFFDLGFGWLLPNWLGYARPSLLDSTNGLLHASTGIELSWTVPGIQVPVRAYYAVNVLRLNRFLQLPNGSVFHAHNRFSAFGWALGTLF